MHFYTGEDTVPFFEMVCIVVNCLFDVFCVFSCKWPRANTDEWYICADFYLLLKIKHHFRFRGIWLFACLERSKKNLANWDAGASTVRIFAVCRMSQQVHTFTSHSTWVQAIGTAAWERGWLTLDQPPPHEKNPLKHSRITLSQVVIDPPHNNMSAPNLIVRKYDVQQKQFSFSIVHFKPH